MPRGDWAATMEVPATAAAYEPFVRWSAISRSIPLDWLVDGTVARIATAACLLVIFANSALGGSRENVEFGAPAIETERIRQWHALEEERDRADRLARELTRVRAELTAARLDRKHAMEAIETGIKQTQALELEREKVSKLARDLSSAKTELDAARIAASKAMQASGAELKQDRTIECGNANENALGEVADLQSDIALAQTATVKPAMAAAAERTQRQALEVDLEQQRKKADALVVELDSLRADLETARTTATEASKAAAAEAGQKQDIERELKLQRDKTDAAVTELSKLRTTVSTIRTEAAANATAADSEHKLALENELTQQRARADAAVKQLASIQAKFDAAQATSVEAHSAEAIQRQSLEQELSKQREKANELARETISLRNERDDARLSIREAIQVTDVAKAEGSKALDRERGKSEALLRQLISARKEIEERSASLAAAYAENLRATEINRAAANQKKALDDEHERANDLARELALVRTQLEEANRKLAPPSAFPSRIPAWAEYSRAADPAVNTNAAGSFGQQTALAVAANPQRSSESGTSTSEAQTIDRISSADSSSSISAMPLASTPTGTASHAIADEQRLLARANALLRQTDISSARRLLELALARGSARAAFMLAETYDPPVLESWRARGVAGDPAKARSLYQRAKAGGIDDAEERIKALK